MDHVGDGGVSRDNKRDICHLSMIQGVSFEEDKMDDDKTHQDDNVVNIAVVFSLENFVGRY